MLFFQTNQKNQVNLVTAMFLLCINKVCVCMYDLACEHMAWFTSTFQHLAPFD